MITVAEWQILYRSLQIAFGATLLCLPFGIWLGYLLGRKHPMPFRFFLTNLVQLPLVLPPVVVGYFLLLVFSPNYALGKWLDSIGMQVVFTVWAAIFAAAIVAFPLMVQTIRVAIEQIDTEWEEAALVYGANKWQVFWWITLPLAQKGILAGIALTFARAFGEFGATIIVAGNIFGKTQTIPLAIFTGLNQIDGTEQVLRLVFIALSISFLSIFLYTWVLRKFTD